MIDSTQINKLKRKYGQTLEQIRSYITESRNRLTLIDNADLRIEQLQKELKSLESSSHHAANLLSENRIKFGKKLEKALSAQLQSLNMPQAQCLVSISPQKRALSGDDDISNSCLFLIKANSQSLKRGS